MSYRNERLNKSMKSLEDSAQGIDMAKWRVLSDCGIGVERMVEAIDWETCVGDRRTTGKAQSSRGNSAFHGNAPTGENTGESMRERRSSRGCNSVNCTFSDDRDDRLFEAEMRLAEAGKSYLIRVLLLIVENGRSRENSINALTAFSKNWNAARKKYFEHRDRLIEFFKSDSGAHGDIEGHAIPRPIPVTSKDRCNRA